MPHQTIATKNLPKSNSTLIISGVWTARNLKAIKSQLAQLQTLVVPDQSEILLDGAKLEKIDSAGFWILQNELDKIRQQGKTIQFLNWPAQYQKLVDVVAIEKDSDSVAPVSEELEPTILARLGKVSYLAMHSVLVLLSFIGEVAQSLVLVMWIPRRWRPRMILRQIQIAGLNALPIIGVTSFLLGIVIAYQGADQLKHYGANIFVVDLLGYSMLREFSPLITAIIVAGRSGSAYAAQIGSMVVNEEIDAMRTIGIAPIELLVLPKIIALLVALPLVTVFSDITGVMGGMVMARSQLAVDFPEFLMRFGHEVQLASFLIGVGKAVVFALVIATIGCFQGFQTKANADSVGQQTTRSVVQSIFIIIIFDALFSVVLSLIDL
ncbi:MlaE family lipid ABC transporter permease subunit [Undibacterium seohonense]|uniref:MlaE family lipid ABC transporter permease subunit n=1 Tax=Undibacterium seohonense TaxID=1344950 RepID=A0ABR6X5C0_9BURK|nr:MlaE family lipid ABC transporter permease subunit [Undibacterium seohonense]MBC3808089.1 MlaE family lipid ABC transporter permease subunit [Undibacterium seohonense]